ncbi:uncharacterized protein LOC129310869 [Prosopis cineraria]|uniref:uncharacterized protein LOC129310869 n=1 Tax=Prosopis cineraria TaxID=364024 RepID=UPI00240EDB8F|nr:uncharacterized protein LOC129310869 [Prosopis cineraria]
MEFLNIILIRPNTTRSVYDVSYRTDVVPKVLMLVVVARLMKLGSNGRRSRGASCNVEIGMRMRFPYSNIWLEEFKLITHEWELLVKSTESASFLEMIFHLLPPSLYVLIKVTRPNYIRGNNTSFCSPIR